MDQDQQKAEAIQLQKYMRSQYQSVDAQERREAEKYIETIEFKDNIYDIVLLIIIDKDVTLSDRQSAVTILKKTSESWKVCKSFDDGNKQYIISKIVDAIFVPDMQFQIIGNHIISIVFTPQIC